MPDQSPIIWHELDTPDLMSSGAFFPIVENYGHRIRN